MRFASVKREKATPKWGKPLVTAMQQIGKRWNPGVSLGTDRGGKCGNAD